MSSLSTVWHRPINCDIIPLAKLQTLKQNTDPCDQSINTTADDELSSVRKSKTVHPPGTTSECQSPSRGESVLYKPVMEAMSSMGIVGVAGKSGYGMQNGKAFLENTNSSPRGRHSYRVQSTQQKPSSSINRSESHRFCRQSPGMYRQMYDTDVE